MVQQASEEMRDDFKDVPSAEDAYRSALAQRQRIREEMQRYFQQQGIIALAFLPIMIPPPQTQFTKFRTRLTQQVTNPRVTDSGQVRRNSANQCGSELTAAHMEIDARWSRFNQASARLRTLSRSACRLEFRESARRARRFRIKGRPSNGPVRSRSQSASAGARRHFPQRGGRVSTRSLGITLRPCSRTSMTKRKPRAFAR